MRRSSEIVGSVLLPAVVAMLGATACGNEEEPGEDKKLQSPPAAVALSLKPQDKIPLKQVAPDAEGRQRAWTPTSPQPWAPGKEVQVDSRNTKPVGGPVGLYWEPRQDASRKAAEVHDGEEYPAVCYVGQEQGAQFIRNDALDGSYMWLQLDADRDGKGDAYLPVANSGFTGLNTQAQPDGAVPRC